MDVVKEEYKKKLNHNNNLRCEYFFTVRLKNHNKFRDKSTSNCNFVNKNLNFFFCGKPVNAEDNITGHMVHSLKMVVNFLNKRMKISTNSIKS